VLPVTAAFANTGTVAPPADAPVAGGGAVFVGLLLALLVIIGVTVKLFDLRRKRMEQAVQVQARIADALLLDPALVNQPVAATAHVPFWSGKPVLVELRGRVPSPELHEQVLHVADRELAAMGIEYRVEDHLAITPTVTAHAA
jgi:hypothetical protein